MRLIDADALMRKFKTASPMAIDGRARQMVEEMPTIQQWIPCSERLPEKNGEYLVTRWTGYLPKSLIIDIAKYYEGEWRKAFPVDAWMPLPEVYKGEQP